MNSGRHLAIHWQFPGKNRLLRPALRRLGRAARRRWHLVEKFACRGNQDQPAASLAVDIVDAHPGAPGRGPGSPGTHAEQAVRALYQAHAVGLIRLAIIMLADRAAAEYQVASIDFTLAAPCASSVDKATLTWASADASSIVGTVTDTVTWEYGIFSMPTAQTARSARCSSIRSSQGLAGRPVPPCVQASWPRETVSVQLRFGKLS
jgi:hypothetical protein